MLRFMKNKILIPLMIVAALATFFSFRYSAEGNSADEKKRVVIETVMKAIQQNHFSPREVNDSFSSNVYKKVLTNLDFDKRIFTQEDISKLSRYEFVLDENGADNFVSFFNDVNTIYSKRINEIEGYYKEALKKPFTFTGNEEINLNGEKVPYAANSTDLKDRWHTYLKYRVLSRYVDMKDDQKKRQDNKDTSLKKIKTDAELEAEARESVTKNMDYYFKRMRKMKDDDRFTLFVNSIAGTVDPHTDFFPPADKARFDEQMSGTFFGIGATLQNDEGKIKIVSIVPGSPCWKQGDLKAGDYILKVAQGNAEPVDIQGYDTEDAVKLIRGKKGTEVRLTVKKVSGAIQVIPIIRDKVEIEETFAKSAIINTKDGPVGYIYLPEFYSDFQHVNGRRSGEDVAIEVMKLKKSGVKGIILDLRYNGGGSLSDVVSMGGLFIDQGPIVQVKGSNTSAVQLDDQQKGTLYDGPLAIMVNYGSASASEILAAAMQDYKRAVVVGSTTFGKGTVQKVLSLDEYRSWLASIAGGNASTGDTLGAIKLTIQKFYRINGGSTQLKGVTPDVVLPDPYSEIEIGERRDKAALKWDEIPAARYTAVPNAVNAAQLAAQSSKRVAGNPSFELIKQSAAKIKKAEEENTYSLNEAKYRQQLEEANATAKKVEDIEKKATQLNITNVKDDLARINLDSSSINKNENWLKALKKDIYLSETVNIVNDMMHMDSRVNLGTGMK